jgi:hypothetical protein
MTSSTLKNILEQTILGCQNVKRLPSNKNWDSSFNINDKFIVEISRVSTDRSIIRVYSFNDFQDQTLSKKITIEFERIKFEDQCAFSIDVKNASREMEDYAYEIIGRVLDRFKGNKIT